MIIMWPRISCQNITMKSGFCQFSSCLEGGIIVDCSSVGYYMTRTLGACHCTGMIRTRNGKGMAVVQFTFVGIILIAWTATSGAEPLDRGGRNVCTKLFSYNSYVPVRSSYVSYENYRTCCKKVLGWCTSRCTKYRTQTRYYYKNVLKVRYGTSVFCCSGWARKGSECTTAICNPVCQNGDCIAPGVCKCKEGFVGSYCETEVDECNATPKPCEQTCTNLRGSYACSCLKGYRKIGSGPKDKGCENVNECAASDRLCKCAITSASCKATCVDTIGSYRCQCSPGFRLIANKVCTDVDECAAGQHNCEQICVNDRGGFKCACKPGYWLRNDMRSCYDLNECRSANGGCEQLCQNIPGSYTCSCRAGFRLMYDKTRCSDLDECITTRPCDQYRGKCFNTFGSYNCGCDKGYELSNDQHTCKDLNECNRINDCEHNCHNSDGSYFCSCKAGYKLAYDKRKCIDIDECQEGLHDCQQLCRNIPGSFRCSCRPEFVLHSDMKSCKPIPCKTLYTPDHGSIQCTGNNAGDTCTVSCVAGYELDGAPVKTCLSTSRWSDDKAKCRPMQCPPMYPPVNGALFLPCVEEYSSQCIVKCKRGYLLEGNPIVSCGLENSRANWTAYNVTCKALNLCNPNPCFNGGRCRPLSQREYECHCEETGFDGKNCEVGLFVLPKYPQMVSGVDSETLVIHARPLNDIAITPEALNGQVTFIPSTITFVTPQREARFKVRAVGQGLVRITYKVSGKDRLLFAQPPDNFLYIVNMSPTDQISAVPDTNYIDSQCEEMTIDRCPNKELVKLASTCPWGSNGTVGYQSVKSKHVSLPLSLAGIALPALRRSKWRYTVEGVLSVAKETANMMNKGLRSCLGSACASSSLGISEHSYIVQANLFLKSFLERRNKLSPWWFRVKTIHGYDGFHINNIQSLILRGESLKQLTACRFPRKLSGIYATNVNFAPLDFKLFTTTTTIRKPNPTCVAIDLCAGMSFVSFPHESSFSLSDTFRSMGIKSFELNLKGLGTNAAGTTEQEKACQTSRDVYTFKESVFCVNPLLWLPLQANYISPNYEVSLSGEVYVEPFSITEFVLRPFASETRGVYFGELKAKFSLMAGGKPFVIDVLDATSTTRGTFSIGDTVGNKCEFCDRRGVELLTKDSKVDFYPSSSIVTFHPTKGSAVQFLLRANIAGGRLQKIADQTRFQLYVRTSVRSLPLSLQSLLLTLRVVETKYKAELTTLNDLKAQFSTKLNSLQKLATASDPDLQLLYLGVEDVLALREQTEDVLRLLNARVLKFEPAGLSAMISGKVRFSLLTLKQLSARLQITPLYERAKELDSGFSISYEGVLCFHALCFGKLKASVHNLNSECSGCQFNTKQGEDVIVINGLFKDNTTYRGILNVAKDTPFIAKVSKNKDEFSLSFSAKLIAFGEPIIVQVTVDNKKISMILKSAKIDTYIRSNLEIVAYISERTRWNTVSFEIQGEVDSTAPLHKKIEKYATDYVRKAQLATKHRLEKIENRVNTTTHELRAQEELLRQKEKFFDAQADTYNKARTQYLRSVAKYNRTVIQFRSYRVGQFFQNLEKRLDDSCTFQTCKQVCISVPTCEICQAPVFVDADTVQCEQKQRSVITTVEEPLSTKCQLTRYRFTPVYTGTCKKGKSQKLTGALVGTGTGVGTLAGMMIAGPVGAAIGGAIGAVVGYFGSMFSSCDESYEVYKEVFNVQLPCTRKVYNPQTKRWTESVCYTVVKKVFSTFDVPEECNCNNGTNSTCIPATDPICIKDNQECRRKREVIVRTSMESAGAYNSSYFDLNAADEEMQVWFFKMKNAEQDYIEAKKNFERQVAIEKKYRLDAKLANQSKENSVEGLRLDRCLMNLGVMVKSLSVLVSQSAKFSSLTLRPLDLLLKVALRSHDGASYPENYLVYDLDDQELSIKKGAEKFVRNMYCKDHTRKRRSLDTDNPVHTSSYDPSHVSGFSSALLSSSENITEATAACLVFQRTSGFLSEAFTALKTKMEAARERKRELQKSIDALKLAIDANVKVSSERLVNAQSQVLQQLETQALRLAQKETGSNVYNAWLTDMEVFSSASNFSSCTSFSDCLDEAVNELSDLPNMFKNGRKAFTEKLEELNAKIIAVGSNSAPLTTHPVVSLLDTIKSVMDSSLHCKQPPRVRLLEKEKLESKLGRVVVLHCEAESSLPVWYEWLHNGTVLPGEYSNQLNIEVVKDAAGKYECEAISRAGRNRSADTFLVVGQTPSVFTEPKNFTYHSSMSKNIIPSFECNVTAEPAATIKWYKRSFATTGLDVPLQLTSPAIRFPNPTLSDAGWYFCEAKNEHGTTRGNLARFDVISSNVPNQALEVKFDMETSGDAVPEKSQYENEVRINGELKKSDSVNVSLQFQGNKKYNLGIKITHDVRSEIKQKVRRVRRDANDDDDGASDLDILKKVSATRQTLASSLEKVVTSLTRRTRRSVGTSISESLRNSLELSFDGDLCPDGHQLHINGFTCVQCLPGYFEHQRVCVKCPIGTYQPNAGQDTCLPCKDDQVTASDGSSSKDECIAPVLESTDVIFILDSSGSLTVADWNRVLYFVADFVQDYFDPNKKVRIGVIVYSSTAILEIPLRSHSKQALMLMIRRLSYQAGVTRTYNALELARKQFLFTKSAGVKQLAIVVTDGKSTPMAGIPGQTFTRNKALELRKSGPRIFSVGIGGQVDPLELLYMASFPKKNNTVHLADFAMLSAYATKVVALSTRGICSIPTTDIAVVVELSERVGIKQLERVKVFLTGLLNALHNLDYNIGLLTLGSDVKLLRRYSPMKTEADVKAALDQLIITSEKQNMKSGIEKLYNDYMTEKFDSYAQRKVILLLTEQELEEGLLQTLQLYYPDEDIVLYNILMSLNQVEEGIENLGVGITRSLFTLSHQTELITELRVNQGHFC